MAAGRGADKASSLRRKRFKLGRYSEISLATFRTAAMEHNVRIARGEDPAAEKKSPKPQGRNVSWLIDEFVKRHASFNKSEKATDRILRR